MQWSFSTILREEDEDDAEKNAERQIVSHVKIVGSGQSMIFYLGGDKGVGPSAWFFSAVCVT